MQFDKSLADSAGPHETRDGAYRQREAFLPLDRTENVEVHHALHRRVLSALTFTPVPVVKKTKNKQLFLRAVSNNIVDSTWFVSGKNLARDTFLCLVQIESKAQISPCVDESKAH